MSEVLKTLAAIVALVIAYSGLSTWARQLRGSDEYNVSRRLLRALFAIREGIWHVRASAIRQGELERAGQQANPVDPGEQQHRVEQAIFENRWRLVQEPWAELETTLLEAEVLWGQAFSDEFNDFRTLLHTLNLNVGYYLSGIASPAAMQARASRWQEITNIATESGSRSAPDEFQRQVNQALEHLESLIRPRLYRSISHGPIRDTFLAIKEGQF